MKKAKHKFKVYVQHYYVSDDDEAVGEWELGGETSAVSHKQAINNIRNRLFGNDYASQYKPQYAGSTYATGYNYKAVDTWTDEEFVIKHPFT